MKSEYVALNHI